MSLVIARLSPKEAMASDDDDHDADIKMKGNLENNETQNGKLVTQQKIEACFMNQKIKKN